MHMFAGTIKKGVSIQGYIEKGLVNPRQIKDRHEALVEEMDRRGYKHQSLLELDCSDLPEYEINIAANIIDLKNRCRECLL